MSEDYNLKSLNVSEWLSTFIDPLGVPYLVVNQYKANTSPAILIKGTSTRHGVISFQDGDTRKGQVQSGQLFGKNYALIFEMFNNANGICFSAYTGVPMITIDNTANIRDYNNVSMLNPTTLGSAIKNSSLTSVGTLKELNVSTFINAPTINPNYSQVKIATNAGLTGQGTDSIAIGNQAGFSLQGSNSIAIGSQAGFTGQHDNTIILNAGGNTLNSDRPDALFVNPIRNTGSDQVLYYNTSTKEVTYSTSTSSVPTGGTANQILTKKSGTDYDSYWSSSLTGTNAWLSGFINAPTINPNQSQVKIATSAGFTGQGANSVAIGNQAGQTNQGANSVAIGINSGLTTQGLNAIAIGRTAGQTNQANNSISIGNEAGLTNQQGSVAIGYVAGRSNQNIFSVAIGDSAGTTSQNTYCVAIGSTAGNNTQGTYGVAIGGNAGQVSQGQNSVAIGRNSGISAQGSDSIAIGNDAGRLSQGINAVSIGRQAGYSQQSSSGISIGNSAGFTGQGINAIAMGNQAGNAGQGANSVAIGNRAGITGQHANTIILNAGSNNLNSDRSDALFVSPIRNTGSSQALYYNTSSKEITSSNVLTLSGIIDATGSTGASNQFLTSNFSGSSLLWKTMGYASVANTNDVFLSANTPTPIGYDTTFWSKGVSYTGSQITFSQTGVYKIGNSLSLDSADTTVSYDVWFSKNGTNIANSASSITIQKKGDPIFAYVEIFESMNSGDYVEVVIATQSPDGHVLANSAITSPYTRPAIPSSIVTVQQIE